MLEYFCYYVIIKMRAISYTYNFVSVCWESDNFFELQNFMSIAYIIVQYVVQ